MHRHGPVGAGTEAARTRRLEVSPGQQGQIPGLRTSVEAPVWGPRDTHAGGGGAKMAAQPLHAGRLDVRDSPQAQLVTNRPLSQETKQQPKKVELYFSPQSGLCLPQTGLWWLQSREAPECTPCPERCTERHS